MPLVAIVGLTMGPPFDHLHCLALYWHEALMAWMFSMSVQDTDLTVGKKRKIKHLDSAPSRRACVPE